MNIKPKPNHKVYLETLRRMSNEQKMPGYYEAKLNGSNLSSGVYFYRLSAGNFTETKKIILMK